MVLLPTKDSAVANTIRYMIRCFVAIVRSLRDWVEYDQVIEVGTKSELRDILNNATINYKQYNLLRI